MSSPDIEVKLAGVSMKRPDVRARLMSCRSVTEERLAEDVHFQALLTFFIENSNQMLDESRVFADIRMSIPMDKRDKF